MCKTLDQKLIDIFKDANCFYECAQMALGAKEGKSINIVNDLRSLMLKAPFCVNIAFACELYLKMIMLKDGIEIPHIHKLGKLYNHLPQKRQEELRILFNISEPVFLSLLKASSDLFEKYRYGFENNNLPKVHGMFMLNLAENLHSICKTLS